MKLFKIYFLFLVVIFSFTASADVPNNINYQGYLTDAVGDPVNGNQTITFQIYDAAVGGIQLWSSGAQVVNVVDGLFEYQLGSNVALPTNIFADTNRYLSIAVFPDPELTPRTKFNSSAYAFQAQTANNLYVYDNNNTLRADALGVNGGFRTFGTDGLIRSSLYSFVFGELLLTDNNGLTTVDIGANTSGGGFLYLYDPAGTNSIYLSAASSGNSTLLLPDSAIDNTEILDEPGIAQGVTNGAVYISGLADMTDIVTVSLTIPGPGYVVVEANAQAAIFGTTASNLMAFQIDKTAGGNFAADYYQYVGYSIPPNTSTIYFPTSARRTYFENSAGTYTYRFEALDGSGNGSKYFWNSTLTAQYFPTSYGTVSTITPNPPENIDAVPISGTNQDGTPMHSYKYDLRQLELKAKAAELKAKEAQLELMKAQRQQEKQSNKE